MSSIHVRLTVYQSPKHTTPIDVWRGPIEDLLSDVDIGPKAELPYLAPHVLKEGGARRGQDIEAVSQLLWLDLDGTWCEEVADRLRAMRWAWWAWPSPSGKPGRARVGVLVSREFSDAAKGKAMLRWIDGQLGGVCDRQSLHAVQGYYHGVEPGVAWWVESGAGEPIDVDRIDLTDPTPAPRPAPSAECLAAWPISWRARQVKDIVGQWGVATEGGRHGSLFRVAMICRDWGVSMDLTREIVHAWNTSHCDPPKDAWIIDSAILHDIDRYRTHPVGYRLRNVIRIGFEHGPALDKAAEEVSPHVFSHDKGLVEIVGSELSTVTEARYSTLLSDHSYWCRLESKEDEETGEVSRRWKRAAPPGWAVPESIAMPEHPAYRRIVDTIPTPVLRPDGSVIEHEGWDKSTGLFVREPLPRPIPHSPSEDDTLESLDRVTSLYADFPLDEYGRAVILAYMLSTVGRAFIPGQIPALILDSNKAQCGKSHLTDTLSMLATGTRVGSTAWHNGIGDTMLRALHASCASHPGFIVFDNVANASILDAPVLDHALTQGELGTRRLFTMKDSTIPYRGITVINGNAVKCGADLSVRAIEVRLVTTLVDPTSAKHAIGNYREHVREHRAAYCADLLVLWRAWISAGCPGEGDGDSWGTYPAWERVRALVRWLGYPDPTHVGVEDTADSFVMALGAWLESRELSASGVLDALRPPRGYGGSADPGDSDARETRAHIIAGFAQLARCNTAELDAARVGRVLRYISDRPTNAGVIRWRTLAGRSKYRFDPSQVGSGGVAGGDNPTS